MKVTVCALLVVPKAWLAKVNEVGLVMAAITPVPVRATVGLLLALSLTVSVPERTPATDGVKKTEMVQLATAASVLGVSGQVLAVV